MAGLDAPAVVSFGGASLAFVLAVVVLRVGRGSAPDWILAGLLLFEGFIQVAFSTSGFAGSPSRWEEGWVAVALWATSVLGALYLLFLSRLDTPLVAWLRRKGARLATITLLVIIPTIFLAATAVFLRGPEYAPGAVNMAIIPLVFGTFAFVIICVYALAAAFSVLRRSPEGTRREQARAYVTAFGARDVLFFIGFGSNFLSDVIVPGVGISESELLELSSIASSMATLIFVPLLAYGILQTKLFDIDLKVKLGLKRSTVATIMLLAVFGAAKVAEFYLNKTYGFIAGGIAAGTVLFLVPRLNKFGEKIANTAMPKVQDTNAYREFRKLEVFKAAVESALEGGELTAKERDSLVRLRVKLGIGEQDAAALETDIRERLALPAGVAAPKPS